MFMQMTTPIRCGSRLQSSGAHAGMAFLLKLHPSVCGRVPAAPPPYQRPRRLLKNATRRSWRLERQCGGCFPSGEVLPARKVDRVSTSRCAPRWCAVPGCSRTRLRTKGCCLRARSNRMAMATLSPAPTPSATTRRWTSCLPPWWSPVDSKCAVRATSSRRTRIPRTLASTVWLTPRDSSRRMCRWPPPRDPQQPPRERRRKVPVTS
mmetsp:Transcript_56799/g.151661  ORF Transcript_56799/g.151661 Transcript_56799/m.151661 type:complete len:207 (+) Transcript_56799:577-1197(+)